MASETEVAFSLFGKDVSASKTLGDVADGFEDAGKKADRYGEHLGKTGERADKAEQRILGVKDAVDGVATIMQGPGEQGMAAYLQGWADLASGVANFAIPALEGVRLSTIKSAAATVWSTATQAAAATGAKLWAAAQWVLNAALSMNPIGLVVIAIVALVAAFIYAWNHSETFRRIVTAALHGVATAAIWVKDRAVEAFKWIVDKFQTVIDFFRRAPGAIRSAASGMWNGILDAFRNVINTIIRGWNRLRFTVPAIDMGPLGSVGGFSVGVPAIPYLARGGIVTGPTLAVLGERGPEAVVPLTGPNAAAAGVGGQHVHLHVPWGFVGSPEQLARAIDDVQRRAGRRGA